MPPLQIVALSLLLVPLCQAEETPAHLGPITGIVASTDDARLTTAATAARALDWHRDGMNFADALHLASARDQRRFATFDQNLRRRSARLQTLPPAVEP